MALTMAEVARDYETDGVPSSGPHKIKKNNLRGWGAWVEGIINAFVNVNGGLIFTSKTSLDASLNYNLNQMAWVLGDATVANNGVYRKIGASGTGSWTRVSDLPFSFIIASDAGVGTANAIQATTSIPVSASALVWMNVFEANTASPVTVSFNGGSALTIKTNTGNNVAAGGLVAGMIVLGIVSGSTFRLLNDQVSSAIVAAAEAAADRAEAAALSVSVIVDYSNSIMSVPSPPPANGVDDDGPYINGALTLLAGKPIFIPRPLRTSGGHVIPAGTSIEGHRSKTLIERIGASNLFTINGNDVVVRDLVIDSVSATAGFDFTIDAVGVTKERIKIKNILTWSSRGFLQDSGSGSGIIVSLRVSDCQMRHHRGKGINLRRAFAYNVFDLVTVDYNGSLNPNFTGFELNGNDIAGVGPAGGYTIDKCDVTGSSSNGFILTNVHDVTVTNSLSDSNGGFGWYATNCLNFRGNLKATLCNDHGVVLDNCSYSDIESVRTRGCNTIAGAANKHGLVIAGAGQDITIGQVYAFECTGSGIAKTGTTSAVSIGNVKATANTRYGIETVNNNAFVVGSGILANNVIANYNLAGSLNKLQSTMLSSGAIVDVSGPGSA